MTGTQAICTALKSTQHLVTWFLADLSDADLLVRPVPGANHIAWQMGHLINSECRALKYFTTTPLALPAGFEVQHNKDTSNSDSGFLSKAEYVALFNQVRQATVAAVAALNDADLDRPIEGPMAAIAPNVGAMALLMANHSMMHGGQFSAVRRKLGKPVLF
jgi:hypothetical protein